MRLEPTRMSMVAWVEGRREQARATTRARDRQGREDCICGGTGWNISDIWVFYLGAGGVWSEE